MGKIRDNISAIIPLFIMLSIGISSFIWCKREHERVKVEKKEQREQWREKTKKEYYRQPMVWNGNSLLIGYQFKDAYFYLDEDSKEITYEKSYNSREQGIRVFDSLVVEICKHHCDSLIPYKFTSKYNREFECSHTGASLTLHYWSYSSSNYSGIEITYKVPQKLGHGVDEEWQQYLRVE